MLAKVLGLDVHVLGPELAEVLANGVAEVADGLIASPAVTR